MPNTTNAAASADEVARLQAENDELRAQLAAAQPANATSFKDRKPTEPSFGLSEGQRAELEMRGKTTSPFTGARQVGDGEPGTKPRVVDQETFDKVKDKQA